MPLRHDAGDLFPECARGAAGRAAVLADAPAVRAALTGSGDLRAGAGWAPGEPVAEAVLASFCGHFTVR